MKIWFLFVLLAAAFLNGCDVCENEGVAEHLSPDGRWKFVTFSRDCGATTGFNLQFSILPASERLPEDEAANAFIADGNGGKTEGVADAEWASATKLRIQYSAKARIYKRETKVGPIEIEYVQQ